MPAFLSRTLVLPEELLVAAFTAYQKEKPFECRPIYGLGPQVRHVVLAGYVLRRESEVVQGPFNAIKSTANVLRTNGSARDSPEIEIALATLASSLSFETGIVVLRSTVIHFSNSWMG